MYGTHLCSCIQPFCNRQYKLQLICNGSRLFKEIKYDTMHEFLQTKIKKSKLLFSSFWKDVNAIWVNRNANGTNTVYTILFLIAKDWILKPP